jgi:hypothetical protein
MWLLFFKTLPFLFPTKTEVLPPFLPYPRRNQVWPPSTAPLRRALALPCAARSPSPVPRPRLPLRCPLPSPSPAPRRASGPLPSRRHIHIGWHSCRRTLKICSFGARYASNGGCGGEREAMLRFKAAMSKNATFCSLFLYRELFCRLDFCSSYSLDIYSFLFPDV